MNDIEENKEKKELIINLEECENESEEVDYQELSNDEEEIYFSVGNMNECPEDAIIGRELFDATDYIRVLKKGMELAQKRIYKY